MVIVLTAIESKTLLKAIKLSHLIIFRMPEMGKKFNSID